MIGLIILFVVGNILDLVTTYLCQFYLPLVKGGGELNPIMKRDVERKTTWWRVIATKAIYTVAVIYMTSPDNTLDVFIMKCLIIVLYLVVINNAYIFIGRKIAGRPIMTLGKYFTEVLHFTNTIAYLLLMGVFFGLSYLFVKFVWV
jgi:hypothetical protein